MYFIWIKILFLLIVIFIFSINRQYVRNMHIIHLMVEQEQWKNKQLITNRYICEVENATLWRFVVIEPTHSWWWLFCLPTTRKRHVHLQQSSVWHHKPLVAAFRNSHIQTWVGEMLHIHLSHKLKTIGLEATFLETKLGDQRHVPATQKYDANQRPNLRLQQYVILIICHGQVTKFLGQAPQITAEYSAGRRNRTPLAWVWFHIRKPRFQMPNKKD